MTLLCDKCGTGDDNPEKIKDNILCQDCQLQALLEADGKPFFRKVRDLETSWEGPSYGGQYTSWQEIEGRCSRTEPERVEFFGQTLSPAQAVELIENFETVQMYLEKHQDMHVGMFAVKVDARFNSGWTDEGVPLHIMEEAVEYWLRPALGI